ncbi:MAG: MFS transporter [Acidobacteriota bacterium]
MGLEYIELEERAAFGQAVRRKIRWRVMPFLIVLFMVAYIDRVNVGYAALEMSHELGFTSEVSGFGTGIFFIGYFMFEIPGSLLVETWSARKWLARIIISWGVVAVLTGLIHSANQFYAARFLLGVAEAGFFPGIIVYLSHWFVQEDRAKAVAMFMIALPAAVIIGGPVSGLMLSVDWFGLAGWRWIFILEGFPAIALGIGTLLYLTDRPGDAKWLAADERAWITEKLAAEKRATESVQKLSIGQAFRNRNVLLMAAGYFCAVTSAYGFTIWLPTILKGLSGYSNTVTGVVSAVPYCVGMAAILFAGWSSDRTGERRWHTAVSLFAVCLGLVLSTVFHENPVASIAMFCIAGAGLYAYLPGFWALPGRFLTGSAAAASIGLINSVGNLGGFAGSYLVGYLNTKTGSFYAGVIYLSCSAFAAAIFVLLVKDSRPDNVST